MATVQNYQTALRSFATHSLRLRAVVATSQQVVKSLGQLATVDPRQVNGELDRSLETWPTPEEIRQALERWKAAYREMHTIWDRLPADDRIGLVGPGEFKTV